MSPVACSQCEYHSCLETWGSLRNLISPQTTQRQNKSIPFHLKLWSCPRYSITGAGPHLLFLSCRDNVIFSNILKLLSLLDWLLAASVNSVQYLGKPRSHQADSTLTSTLKSPCLQPWSSLLLEAWRNTQGHWHRHSSYALEERMFAAGQDFEKQGADSSKTHV